MTTLPSLPRSKTKKRRRRTLLIAAVVLLIVGGVVAWRWTRSGSEVIPVKLDKVTRRSLTETVVANGKIQPVTQVLISPEVAGEIIQLPVIEGQRVKKGDLLVQIRPDTYAAGRNS